MIIMMMMTMLTMTIAADAHSESPVVVEATTVFGATVIIIFAFLVFFLYINQKWCLIDLKSFQFFCHDDTASKVNHGKNLAKGPLFSHQNFNSENLISLAEKGKVGAGISHSSEGSTTSGEEEISRIKALRHRDSRSSGKSNKCRRSSSVDEVENVNAIALYQQQADPSELNAAYTNDVLNIQDDIFDVMDLQNGFEDFETTPKSLWGCLEVAFAYDAPMRKMTIHVLQARDVPKKERGGPSYTQVRLLMLPGKKQKHKTKIRSGESPQFMESFLLHRINPEDVNGMGVRFRLYACERMRRERMIGECVVSFSTLNLELETTLWLMLEPKANAALNSSTADLRSLTRSDSASSTHSKQHGGVSELLLGLAYNGTTGRLSVEVIKGSHFSLCGAYKNPTMPKVPDTYIKLCLISSTGREITRYKTSVRRGQPNPLFKELFMFQVTLFQLPDVTLMVSVYMKRGMKRKEMVGWFSLGLNSSGEEELMHWNDMRDADRELITRWHVLIDT